MCIKLLTTLIATYSLKIVCYQIDTYVLPKKKIDTYVTAKHQWRRKTERHISPDFLFSFNGVSCIHSIQSSTSWDNGIMIHQLHDKFSMHVEIMWHWVHYHIHCLYMFLNQTGLNNASKSTKIICAYKIDLYYLRITCFLRLTCFQQQQEEILFCRKFGFKTN